MTKKASEIPKEWKYITLGELAEKIIDNRGKTPPIVNHGFELLEVNAILEKQRTPDYSRVTKFVDEETFNNWFRTGNISEEDILIPTVGTIGNVSFSKLSRGAIAQNLIAFRTNKEKAEPLLIYYLLKAPCYKTQILKLDIGGVQPSIKVPHLLDLEICLSSLSEQRAIAAVLSSLDDKIELLCEQNKTLESVARVIYREWFVKFKFPGATGKMVDSELGEIPDGWRIFKLEEIVDTVNGYSYKGSELKEKSEDALVTLKSFDRSGGFQVRGFKPFIGTPKPEQEVRLGDLVVAHTDLTQDAEVLGNSAFIFDDGGYRKMYITMDLVKIIPRNPNITKGFFYYLMSMHSFKKHCVGYANGTTVLHLSKRAIPEYEIALPEDLLLVKEFSKIANVATRKIINNFSQIQTLSFLRDTLLPKLIRGEVRVKGFNG
jgi:type I restriction enzyme, S subunit